MSREGAVSVSLPSLGTLNPAMSKLDELMERVVSEYRGDQRPIMSVSPELGAYLMAWVGVVRSDFWSYHASLIDNLLIISIKYFYSFAYMRYNSASINRQSSRVPLLSRVGPCCVPSRRRYPTLFTTFCRPPCSRHYFFPTLLTRIG